MKTTRFPRFARISTMEFFDESAGGDIRKGFPGVLGIRKTLPLDEILETTIIIAFRVQDILDFEIFLVVFDVKCRGRRRTTGFEGRGSNKIEEGDVEDVVQVAHRWGQGELVSLQSDTFYNFVGTKTLPIELLRGAGGGDI
jgi:hypothetical protein